MSYQSTKIIDGFSTCFRQWRAEGTHCKYLHGYSVSFKLVFEGDLDYRNWVFDFGGLKRAKEGILVETDSSGSTYLTPKDWFSYMFDHTTVIAEDDPLKSTFIELAEEGGLRLRILPRVGCELFAEFVYSKIEEWLSREYQDSRIKLVSIECFEHSKNSAIYSKNSNITEIILNR